LAVKIVTDSTAYLDKEVVEKYDITVIPLIVNYENRSIQETEIDENEFYELIKKEDFPTTSQPPLIEIQQSFLKILEQGHDICAIVISAHLSGTYSSALVAKNICLKKYPDRNIEIVNSRGACMGNVVLHAAQRAARGDNLNIILQTAQQMLNKISFFFIPATLEYLKKGGRIGGAQYLLGSILDIKPILTFKDGEVAVVEKVRTKEKALGKLVDFLEKDIQTKEIVELIVGHVYCPLEAEKIANLLAVKFKKEVKIKPIGPVVGMHVGPGTIGLGYYSL
jgi:DegV family protein with EDD domain